MPDERYDLGGKLLHYRKPTDEEERMKITERWHHVVVDLAKHPYYEVRDAEGRVLSCNARFLMRDHTAVGGSSGRRPREPSVKRRGTRVEDWALTAGTMVFLESGDPSEPWRLAAVAKSQVACRGGQVRVHYFNRYNNSARVENQSWRPAYFDARDRLGRDVCTYVPKPWYEGYLTVVRKDMILLKDVMMTGNDRISRGDLRRLSALERVEW